MSSATCLEAARENTTARRVAPLVLVTGGKGGVGKSTIAANLGVSLAARGRRVLLVDLDLGLANLDVLLRLQPAHTVEDALAGECELKDCVVRGPGGVSVLPAGSGSLAMGHPDAERRAALLDGLRELSVDYDLVLGDSAAGIGHDVLGFAAHADRVLLVTTPEPAAMTDAYGLVKALDGWGREQRTELATPELVINQAAGLEEAERTGERLRSVCERFLCRSPRVAGWLPRAPEVARAAQMQRLFALEGRDGLAQRCLNRIAERLERVLVAPR